MHGKKNQKETKYCSIIEISRVYEICHNLLRKENLYKELIKV